MKEFIQQLVKIITDIFNIWNNTAEKREQQGLKQEAQEIEEQVQELEKKLNKAIKYGEINDIVYYRSTIGMYLRRLRNIKYRIGKR